MEAEGFEAFYINESFGLKDGDEKI